MYSTNFASESVSQKLSSKIVFARMFALSVQEGFGEESQRRESSFSGRISGLVVYRRGDSKFGLSPSEKSTRPVDHPDHVCGNNRGGRGHLLASRGAMVALGAFSLARLSRGHKRAQFAAGCDRARRASLGYRIFLAGATDFQIFSACGCRMMRFAWISRSVLLRMMVLTALFLEACGKLISFDANSGASGQNLCRAELSARACFMPD